ncbi:type II secretion system F family protein, partial [Candidatus Microgenomates bacterium]|nr:type II secretion system F family protein [Candidatus Microgenomates bacterium]
MQKYKYSARDANGKVVQGEIEAKDEASVADILHDRGLIVVSVKEGFGLDLEQLNEINIGGVPMKDKVVFMRQMATMVGSGLPLTRSLEIMQMQASNPLFKKVLKNVLKSIEAGKSLSDSFREQDEIFDPITINLIEAGEESGNLEVILGKLATELEEKNALGSKIKSTMIYPIIILLVIVVVIILMMFVLVPSMAEIYEDFDAELPWTTTLLMNMSAFFVSYWWAVILVVTVVSVGIKYYLDTERGKRTFDKIILKIPGVGPIVSKMQLSQFT